jgi:hypothetical protein
MVVVLEIGVDEPLELGWENIYADWSWDGASSAGCKWHL